MQVKKNVYSSNKTFRQLEVNVDTVFYRFNEKKWLEKDDETGKEVQLGWIYDEIWYDKDNYIEEVSKENKKLSQALIEITMMSAENNQQNKQAIVELANMIGGLM